MTCEVSASPPLLREPAWRSSLTACAGIACAGIPLRAAPAAAGAAQQGGGGGGGAAQELQQPPPQEQEPTPQSPPTSRAQTDAHVPSASCDLLSDSPHSTRTIHSLLTADGVVACLAGEDVTPDNVAKWCEGPQAPLRPRREVELAEALAEFYACVNREMASSDKCLAGNSSLWLSLSVAVSVSVSLSLCLSRFLSSFFFLSLSRSLSLVSIGRVPRWTKRLAVR